MSVSTLSSFMEQSELPLYPKLSSIYNKIMQLVIAIISIIVLMNLGLFSHNQNKQVINDHFYYVGQQYLKQTMAGLSVLIDQDKTLLNRYIEELEKADWLKDIYVYDLTGQLIAGTKNGNTIKELYGISPLKLNKSNQFVPFVGEINTKKLQGYVRITIKREYLTASLSERNTEQFSLLRLMMLIAVVVGFLLTRGLNRFSRQGFRLGRV